MRHEPAISGQSLGYISSGRMAADIKRDEARDELELARRFKRLDMPNTSGQHVRRARRAWRRYLELRERIIQ